MPPRPAELPRGEQIERNEVPPESTERGRETLELMSNQEALEELTERAKEAETRGKEERKELDLSKKTMESVAQRYGVELDAEAANDNAKIDAEADASTKRFKEALKEAQKPDAKPQTAQDAELAQIDAGWDKIATDHEEKAQQTAELAKIDAGWDDIAAEAPKETAPAATAQVESGIELTSLQDQMAEVQKTADKEATIEGSLMSMQEQMQYVQRVADAAPRPLEKPRAEKPPVPKKAPEAIPEVADEDILEVTPAQSAPEAKPDTAAVEAARLAELQAMEQKLVADYDKLAAQVATEAQFMTPDDAKAYKKALKSGDMSALPKATQTETAMNDTFKRLNALRAEKNALLSGQKAAEKPAAAQAKPAAEQPRAEAKQAAPASEAAPAFEMPSVEAIVKDGELLTVESDMAAMEGELDKLPPGPASSAARESRQKDIERMRAAVERMSAPEGLRKEIAKLQMKIDDRMNRMVGVSESEEKAHLQAIEALVTQVRELQRRQRESGAEQSSPDGRQAASAGFENPEADEELTATMLEDDPRYNELYDKKAAQLKAKGVEKKQIDLEAAEWAQTMFKKKFPEDAGVYEERRKRKDEMLGADKPEA